uniref:Uncharacterized protein n=1 Tax=Oryza rufipogon TaxID=4529 RepID=A0A0E0NBR1_ORYRU
MASRQAPPPPPEAQEPLLPPPADHHPQADAADGGGGDGWATFVGYSLAALNSTLEIRRFERGESFAAGAAVFAYPHLLLLLYFYFLTRFQGAPPRGLPGIRDRLKAPLWPLAALLAVEFAYQLTGSARLTPRALEIAAAAAAIGATYAFLQR